MLKITKLNMKIIKINNIVPLETSTIKDFLLYVAGIPNGFNIAYNYESISKHLSLTQIIVIASNYENLNLNIIPHRTKHIWLSKLN